MALNTAVRRVNLNILFKPVDWDNEGGFYLTNYTENPYAFIFYPNVGFKNYRRLPIIESLLTDKHKDRLKFLTNDPNDIEDGILENEYADDYDYDEPEDAWKEDLTDIYKYDSTRLSCLDCDAVRSLSDDPTTFCGKQLGCLNCRKCEVYQIRSSASGMFENAEQFNTFIDYIRPKMLVANQCYMMEFDHNLPIVNRIPVLDKQTEERFGYTLDFDRMNLYLRIDPECKSQIEFAELKLRDVAAMV